MIEEHFQRFLDEHGLDYKVNDRSFVLTCPQCDKSKHLYLFKDTGVGKCMKCSTVFSPQHFIMTVTGCSYGEAKSIIESGVTARSDEMLSGSLAALQRANTPTVEPKIFQLPMNFHPITPSNPYLLKGTEYLRSRGVDDKMIERYDLRYCPDMERIVIPVYNAKHECVGWQARDVTGKAELKITSPKGFDRSQCLGGFNHVLVERPSHVVLVEGPFDMFKVSHLGGAICSFGKAITTQQIRMIQSLNFVKRVYLGLDPDAFDVVDQYAAQLEPEKEAWLIQPPEHRKDFGECTTDEVSKSMEVSKKYTKIGVLPGSLLR